MTLRKAARRISHFYDGKLAPTGLRATQYSILALLSELKEVSINDLARHLDLDRTTTGKNLRPLQRAKLVAVTPSLTDGRSRTIKLTGAGSAILKVATPLWRRAQAEFEASNGSKAVGALRQTLRNLRWAA
jgi:DNA-binding MarR family transcriptional regulator